jgi:hypothetical protein
MIFCKHSQSAQQCRLRFAAQQIPLQHAKSAEKTSALTASARHANPVTDDFPGCNPTIYYKKTKG